MYFALLRNILFLMVITCSASLAIMATTSSQAMAADTAEEKQAKKDNKNLAQFEKELIKLESALREELGGKAASKASKSAQRFYKRLSDTIKSTGKVNSLKVKLDKLSDQVKTKLAAEKAIKKDLKSLKTATINMDKVDGYISAQSVTSARRSLNQATSSFTKISSKSLKKEDFKTAKARLDKLSVTVEGMEKQAEQQRQLATNTIFSASSFRTYIPENRVIGLLARGASKTDSDRPMDARELQKAYEATDFTLLEKQFREKYAVLLQTQADTAQSNGITPNMVLEIFKNRVKFRDNFILQNGINFLNWKINTLEEERQRLNDKQYMLRLSSILHELYGDKANKPFAEVTEISQYFDWTGQALPKIEVDKLAKYKPMLRKALKEAAQQNKWDKTKSPYKNDLIEKLAQSTCPSGLKLIEVGVTGKDDWYISKNAYGIPLFRQVDGFMLCKHPNEPFKRGYYVGFSGQYNGIGYEKLSSSTITNNTITPIQ